MPKKNFYVVINGRKPGTYTTWTECKSQVDGFPNAKFKGFSSFEEAEDYIKISNAVNPTVSCENISKIKSQTTYNENDCQMKTKETNKKYAPKVTSIGARKRKFDSINTNLTNESEDHSRVHVYTDGSCRKTKSGNIAGYGVYFGDNSELNVSAKYEGVQTNNRAEIAAVVKAVQMASKHGIKKLLVHTDSQFVINCMTQWIENWKKRNWLLSNNKEAECRDELEKLDNLIRDTKIDVAWKHVRGHKGIKGNEMADKLANQGADQWLK